MFIQPGVVAHEYIHGKRKEILNPLSFLVITAAVSALFTGASGYYEALTEGRQLPESAHPMWLKVFKFSNNNTKLLDILLIFPLLTISSWIFFQKAKVYPGRTFCGQCIYFWTGQCVSCCCTCSSLPDPSGIHTVLAEPVSDHPFDLPDGYVQTGVQAENYLDRPENHPDHVSVCCQFLGFAAWLRVSQASVT